MNNYFGIGLDAKISLDFNNKRDEHPEKCRWVMSFTSSFLLLEQGTYCPEPEGKGLCRVLRQEAKASPNTMCQKVEVLSQVWGNPGGQPGGGFPGWASSGQINTRKCVSSRWEQAKSPKS